MIQRCYNHQRKNYDRYGGRGITVCKRWREAFAAFLEDMGEPPTQQHSIDRINNDGNYEPGNCRWATALEQSRNSHHNVTLSYNGETMCISEWAEKLNMAYSALYFRIAGGWSVERAFSQPVRRRRA